MPRISNGFARYANEYAEKGLPVVPLVPRSKRPAGGAGWQKRSTTDPTKIERLAAQFPDAGLGFNLRDTGVVVVDVDSPDEYDLDAYPLPETHQVRSRRGLHHYYRLPEGTNAATTKIAGADLVCSALIVGPGTLHPETGQPYRVVSRDTEFAPAPQWLVELVKRDHAPSHHPPARGTAKPTGRNADDSWRRQMQVVGVIYDAPEGYRNERTHWAFCRAYEAGGNPEFVRRVEEVALAVGLPADEVESTMRSAYNRIRADFDLPDLK